LESFSEILFTKVKENFVWLLHPIGKDSLSGTSRYRER